jgi:hypothetical protein
MPKTRESNGSGALYLGTLIVIVSVVIWSEYKTYYLGTWIALCAGGFVLWFIGFASTRHLTSAGSQVKSELAGSSRESCLKTFYLNGYFFQPIEQETSNGRKQFRLSSTLPLSHDYEAAVIRYLINEGISEKMWPPISRRIEEEANWAFFV